MVHTHGRDEAESSAHKERRWAREKEMLFRKIDEQSQVIRDLTAAVEQRLSLYEPYTEEAEV